MAKCDQQVHEFCRFVGGLRSEQADAQPDRRQARLLGFSKPGIKRFDQLRKALRPAGPMGWIDDRVRVARAACGKTMRKSPGEIGELLARAHQPANPVQELQKLAQATVEAQQLIARFGQRTTSLGREANYIIDLKGPLKVNMNLRLWQGDDPSTHAAPSHPAFRQATQYV
jgi:hypothetical protein